MPETGAWPAGLALLGLIAGSFLATLVIRCPARRPVVHGRSACDGCGAALGAWELVPLASYAAQLGRCRRCGAAIDPLHPQIELACAAVGAAAGLVAPGPAAAAGALFGWLLVALAALDARAYWLPDALTAPLALLGLGAGLLQVPPDLKERLIGGVAGFAALWLLGWGYRRLRGREGLGGGDPKLLGAIGLWLGWRMLPFVLLLASATGVLLVILARLRGARISATDRQPLGALMAIAAYPLWLVMIGWDL